MPKTPLVLVVALADIARCSRMQYHCFSLLNLGYSVEFLGFQGGDEMPEFLTTNKRFRSRRINVPSPPSYRFKILNSILHIYRFLYITFVFTYLFLISGKPSMIFVQTPPAIPILTISSLFSKIHKAKLIIDWHNTTHCELKKICRYYEKLHSKSAFLNITSTKAVYKFLINELHAQNVYNLTDIPSELFSPSLINKNELYDKIGALVDEDVSGCAIINCAMGWMTNETFEILTSAIKTLDQFVSSAGLQYCFILNAKGPNVFKSKAVCKYLNNRVLMHCKIIPMWFRPTTEYPSMIASCDITIIIHHTFSGLDIPMKIYDSLGSGVPVLVKYYETLSEAIIVGNNGLMFSTSEELAMQILTLIPEGKVSDSLLTMKDFVLKNHGDRSVKFIERWNSSVGLVIEEKK